MDSAVKHTAELLQSLVESYDNIELGKDKQKITNEFKMLSMDVFQSIGKCFEDINKLVDKTLNFIERTESLHDLIPDESAITEARQGKRMGFSDADFEEIIDKEPQDIEKVMKEIYIHNTLQFATSLLTAFASLEEIQEEEK